MAVARSLGDMEEQADLRAVQKRCAGDFLLAERPCECTRKARDWAMLGIADYLMEEVLSANGTSSQAVGEAEKSANNKKGT
jgi:hypothetical protein